MQVFNKWELPYRMHSAQSRRIPNLMLNLDLTWRGVFREEEYKRHQNHSGGGAHGWDNLHKEMQAIFVAHGPSFKRNLAVRPFENVELYNLMCALVNVTPAHNNGTWGALHHLLVDVPSTGYTSNETAEEEAPAEGLYEVMMVLRMPFEMQVDSDNACKALYKDNQSSVALPFDPQDFNVNMTEERENELLFEHAPLGVPILLINRNSPFSNNSLLINEDYLAGLFIKNFILRLSE